MTRYPGLVIALSWSAALAAAVVLIPGQPAVGAIAIAATVPLLVLSLLVRPALIAFALVAALLAVGRAELPAADPQIPLPAAALAGGIGALPAWLRSGFTSTVDAALPRPHSAVLLGIVLGIRQGIPTELQNALIATGLIHLLVLSGLKVAVFARIVQGALTPVLGRFATRPAVALLALYAMVGGATPAAVRASAMGGLAIAASHLGRPSHVWPSLALTAAAMLGWRPELAWDVGFQLSLAAPRRSSC